jgi:hypothetical protein
VYSLGTQLCVKLSSQGACARVRWLAPACMAAWLGANQSLVDNGGVQCFPTSHATAARPARLPERRSCAAEHGIIVMIYASR